MPENRDEFPNQMPDRVQRAQRFRRLPSTSKKPIVHAHGPEDSDNPLTRRDMLKAIGAGIAAATVEFARERLSDNPPYSPDAFLSKRPLVPPTPKPAVLPQSARVPGLSPALKPAGQTMEIEPEQKKRTKTAIVYGCHLFRCNEQRKRRRAAKSRCTN